HDDRVEGRRVDQGDDDRRFRADRGRPPCVRDAGARRPGEHPVLPRRGRLVRRHRHQPALRRRLPAADRGREPLPGARPRARGRGAAGAPARRFPPRALHDPLLLRARAVGRGGRYVGAVRGRAARTARRALAAVVLAGVAAACGGPHDTGKPLGAAPVPSVRRESPGLTVVGPVRLEVTVVDGDRNFRVRRAAVRLWGRSVRTGRDGVAAVVVPHRRGLRVTVGAPGFGTRSVWEDFQSSRKVTIRVYRPELQWPLYGATPTRTQAQTHIHLRPPFKVVWSRGMGTLIEFPAVVDDGVAYIGNAHATVRAISMRTGRVLWRHDTPHGQMASSPGVFGSELVYHSMDGHVEVLDRATGTLLWSYWIGSPIESSP